MRKLLTQIADFVAFWRPLLLIPIWTPALLGFWAGGGNQGTKGATDLLITTTLLGIGIYGLNQIFDAPGDRLNRKNLPLALGFISPLMAKITVFLAFAGAIIMTIDRTLLTLTLIVVAIVLGVCYSAPPMRLKDRGYLALAANSLGHGFLIYILGFAWAAEKSGARWEWIVFARALSYAVAFGAVYLFTTVPDADGDKKVGKKTLAVIWGARKTMALGLLGVFLAGAMGVAFGETALFLTAVVSVPFYWRAISEPTIDNHKIVRANQVAVLVLALLTCFYMPQYLALIFAAIVFSALYNRIRLKVKYP